MSQVKQLEDMQQELIEPLTLIDVAIDNNERKMFSINDLEQILLAMDKEVVEIDEQIGNDRIALSTEKRFTLAGQIVGLNSAGRKIKQLLMQL